MNGNRRLDRLKRNTAKILLFFLIVQLKIELNVAKREYCDIRIDSNWYERFPLYFDEKGELYDVTVDQHTGKQTLNIEYHKEVILSCAPNYFRNYADNRTTFLSGAYNRCEFETQTGSGQKETMISTQCDLRVIEEVVDKEAVPACVNSEWTATRYGYVHPLEQLTHIVGEACYDEQAGRTIFAHVKLNGDKSLPLQTSSPSYLTRHRHPDGRYKIELFRGVIFEKIYNELGKATGVRPPFFSINNFINEPLLSNPQLREVKKLGWNYLVVDEEVNALHALKSDVRKLSVRQPLDVFVGASGVRTLAKNVEIYLHAAARPKRFPMPKWIWLLVQHGQQVTGFGIFNGAASEQPAEPLCESVCSEITWLAKSRTLPDNAFVCCKYAELKAALPELPALGLVNGLLV